MIDQLILSKRLFIQGQIFTEQNDPISAGMAISLFQDSVEMLCWGIIKQYDVPIKKEKTPFTSYADAIKEKTGRQIQYWAKILDLNTARINFKHYGNLPNPSEAVKFSVYTEDYLRASFIDFFDKEYDEISLSLLIPFDDVRSHILCAEQNLRDDNYNECYNCPQKLDSH
ncbi:hypothetical protein JXA32_06945 [Candidatus Sumerlaeota bacterium]|nr:hypothetical protein [Candidatus Sumerlaeota bacterium]